MKQVAGIYLPDAEAHMTTYLQQSGGVYQSKQLNRALQFVTNWKTAVDIGAHVGMWSKILVTKFDRVVAFEPMAPLRACLEKNVISPKIQVIPIALGNRHGAVSFDYDESHTGATHVKAQSTGMIPLGMLDDFQLKDVGFIKIDTEGFELPVLEGAKQTIIDCKPIIIVEDKLHGVKHYGQKPYAIIEFLESIGAQVMDRIIDDFVVGYPEVIGKVQKLPPRAADEQFKEAMARLQAGDTAGSRIAFRKLLREYPQFAEGWNMLAIVEMQLGQQRIGLDYALNAVELQPTEARFQNTLATTLWMNGMAADAVDTLKRAIQINPDLFEAHLNLGEIYEQAKEHALAFSCFQQALRIKPHSPEVLVKMGRIHAKHGSAAQASTLFRQALAINPANETARKGLAAMDSKAAG
jgi:FkbM family methyltransferase